MINPTDKSPGFFNQLKGVKEGLTNGVKDKINAHPKIAAITMIALGILAALLFVSTGMTLFMSPMIMLLGGGLIIGAIVLLSSRNSKIGALARKISPIVVPIIFAAGVAGIWVASMMAGGPLASGIMGALFYVAVGGTALIPLFIAQYTIPEMTRRKNSRSKGPGSRTPNQRPLNQGSEPQARRKRIENKKSINNNNIQPTHKTHRAHGRDSSSQVFTATDDFITHYRGDLNTFQNSNVSAQSLRDMDHDTRERATKDITNTSNYIYWMFPPAIDKGDSVPLLTTQLQDEFRKPGLFRASMEKSFHTMLDYYGLSYNAKNKEIVRGANWKERSGYWLSKKSPEFSQISLMVSTMSRCGFTTETKALVDFLEKLSFKEGKNIPKTSLTLWKNIINHSK